MNKLFTLLLLAAALVTFFANDLSCLEMLGCSAAGSPDRYTVTIKLRYEGDRLFSFKETVTRNQFNSIEMVGQRKAARAIDHARRALADKMGYLSMAFGNDRDDLVPCTVVKITLCDTFRNKSQTVFVDRNFFYGD